MFDRKKTTNEDKQLLLIIIVCFFIFVADIISCVEFNHDGDLLATGDKGGRVVIFQRDPIVSPKKSKINKKY